MTRGGASVEKELFIRQLRPYLYLLDEAHEATGYLLIGEDKACVIDTMMGYHNLSEVVRGITGKPVMVINTHGHPDHILGNMYFQEAYIHPADVALAESFMQYPDFAQAVQEHGGGMPPYREIRGGDLVDLGGRTLKVYEIPGHTPGGILLLDAEDRILFTGDSVNHHLWMQLDGCAPLEEFLSTLDGLMFLEKEADVILHGHARDYDDITLLGCVRDGIREICEGKTQDDKPYEYFEGTAKQHAFSVRPDRHYQQDDHVICYR